MEMPKLTEAPSITALGGWPMASAPANAPEPAPSKRPKTDAPSLKTPVKKADGQWQREVALLREELFKHKEGLGNTMGMMLKMVKELSEKQAKQEADLIQLNQRLNLEFTNLHSQVSTTTTVANAHFTSQQSQLQTLAELVRDLSNRQKEGTQALAEIATLFQKVAVIKAMGDGGLEKLLGANMDDENDDEMPVMKK